jgi:hypothetical protein
MERRVMTVSSYGYANIKAQREEGIKRRILEGHIKKNE